MELVLENTHCSSVQSLINKVSCWNKNKGRKRGRPLHSHTLASPHYPSITASLSPELILFHPQNSLFICTGNSCLNVSLSGKKRQMSNTHSISRNI